MNYPAPLQQFPSASSTPPFPDDPDAPPAWEIARSYLRREYRYAPDNFLPRLADVLRRENFHLPENCPYCLQEVVTDVAEPAPWERQFLCAIASAWVTENELARTG